MPTGIKTKTALIKFACVPKGYKFVEVGETLRDMDNKEYLRLIFTKDEKT